MSDVKVTVTPLVTAVKPGVVDLDAMNIYTADGLAADAYARVLLLGAPKAGKSVALASAPTPYIINCDGANALRGAVNQEKKFYAIDVHSSSGFTKAVSNAEKLVKAGLVKSVVVDTITLLADTVLDDLKVKGFAGFDLWNEFDAAIRIPLKQLLKLEAHVFASAHIDGGADEKAGILPLFPGSGKRKIAGMFSEWIYIDYQPGRKPERQFILTGQDNWHGGCRNFKRIEVCDATVSALFNALGIAE